MGSNHLPITMWRKIKKILSLKSLWKRRRSPREITPLQPSPEPNDETSPGLEICNTDDTKFKGDSTQENLRELTERLLENDDNNCAKFLEYNLQERRQGNKDVCKGSLFTEVQPELYNVPTIQGKELDEQIQK